MSLLVCAPPGVNLIVKVSKGVFTKTKTVPERQEMAELAAELADLDQRDKLLDDAIRELQRATRELQSTPAAKNAWVSKGDIQRCESLKEQTVVAVCWEAGHESELCVPDPPDYLPVAFTPKYTCDIFSNAPITHLMINTPDDTHFEETTVSTSTTLHLTS